MPLTVEEFVKLHPKLFHMAEAGSWESIQQHGLMSTEALLDLFEIQDEERAALIECHRPECVTITHPKHGEAVIRDQKPMSDSGLNKALSDNLTPADWYRKLNGKTFFWTTEARLSRLLSASAYRDKQHTVLTVDSAEMFARHAARITFSPYNSGATKPNPFSRGNDCFLPLDQFQYESWRKKGRRKDDAFVELVVEYSIPDVAEFTDRVELRHGNKVVEVLYTKPNK